MRASRLLSLLLLLQSRGRMTAGELAALAALGVTLGQGFLLGRPSEPWTPIAPAAVSAIGHVQQLGLMPGMAGNNGGGAINRRLARTAGRR